MLTNDSLPFLMHQLLVFSGERHDVHAVVERGNYLHGMINEEIRM